MLCLDSTLCSEKEKEEKEECNIGEQLSTIMAHNKYREKPKWLPSHRESDMLKICQEATFPFPFLLGRSSGRRADIKKGENRNLYCEARTYAGAA